MRHRNLRRYLRHGTLTQLSVFEAVARLGSFTRAARELHLAQPTVSVQVKKLSETVGLPLFEMVGRRVQMTDAARELYAACQDIFQRIADVEIRLAAIRGAPGSRLRLAISTTAKYFVPRLLAHFADANPGTDISLSVLNRQNLLHRLLADADDVYIFSNPPEDIPVVLHPLLPNPIYVYARRDHRFAGRKRISLAELAGEPFLMREPGSGTQLAVTTAAAAAGVRLNVRMELGSNEAIKQAIIGGLGISALSRHAIGPAGQGDELIELDVEGFPLAQWWYLVYPEGKTLPNMAERFVRAVTAPGAMQALVQPESHGTQAPPPAPVISPRPAETSRGRHGEDVPRSGTQEGGRRRR